MACGLFKLKKETVTHFVGKTGNEYPKKEYCNIGGGAMKRGLKDLPENEYPYTFKLKIEPLFECCMHCDCDKN